MGGGLVDIMNLFMMLPAHAHPPALSGSSVGLPGCHHLRGLKQNDCARSSRFDFLRIERPGRFSGLWPGSRAGAWIDAAILAALRTP